LHAREISKVRVSRSGRSTLIDLADPGRSRRRAECPRGFATELGRDALRTRPVFGNEGPGFAGFFADIRTPDFSVPA